MGVLFVQPRKAHEVNIPTLRRVGHENRGFNGVGWPVDGYDTEGHGSGTHGEAEKLLCGLDEHATAN